MAGFHSDTTAAAALAEMRFFSRIMFEHAKFIRGGLDPTREQETLIRRADRFARRYGRLEEAADEAYKPERVYRMVEESIVLTEPFRDFQAELARMLDSCRGTAYLPPELIEHIRKEAHFYLGLLYRICGQDTPTRQSLGIPDGLRRVLLLPRLLIGCVQADPNILAQEYGLFWMQRHLEHASVLGLYTRPGQEGLRETLAAYRSEFSSLYDGGVVLIGMADCGTLSPAWTDWLGRALALTVRWREFLAGLYSDLLACRVPTAQINIYPLIVDHIRRESDYTLDVLNRILAAAGASS